ncbi:hypothetical protein D9M69_681090 [compost metagenome]
MFAVLGRIIDCGLGSCLFGEFDRFFVNRTFDQHTCWRIAGLAGILKAMVHTTLNCLFQIAISEHDVWRLAAQFQRNALDGCSSST